MKEIKIESGNLRLRRLRQDERFRLLVNETKIQAAQLVAPYFVVEGKKIKREITSMPGQFQFSIDRLLPELEELVAAGIGSILLFGVPSEKAEDGSVAHAAQGIIPQAIREIKKKFPSLLVMSDVCLCAYTTHGHCGIVKKNGNSFRIENDATVAALAKMAVAHAEAGVDLVAPSDMMDGRVAAIRRALDQKEFAETPIMSYAVKFASSFYGPFRDAAESPPQFGDRRSYQMDVANLDEALREATLDAEEGADILMVKPALTSLDVIAKLKQKFHLPVAAYNVSGEYSMVKAAAARGWLDEKAAALEQLTAIRRAGAQIIVTYWAKQAGNWLNR